MPVLSRIFQYVFSPFVVDERENQALNGVRAIAILLVTAFHCWIPLSAVSKIFPGALRTILGNVNSGVDLFFVLSGYLIYGGLLKWESEPESIDKLRFLTRRVLRIFPAYYFYLIVSVIFFHSRIHELSIGGGPLPAQKAEFDLLSASVSHWYADFLFISNFTDHKLSLVSWSLAIEQQFYIVLPFLAVFLLKLRLQRRLVILAALSAAALGFRIYYETMNYYQTYLYFTQCRMDSLLAGMILAEIERRIRGSGKAWSIGMKWQITLFAGAIGVLYVGHAFTLEHWFRRVLAYNCYILGYTAVLYLAVLDRGVVQSFFAMPAFRPIARMSYTMYLWNITSIGLAAKLVLRHWGDFSQFDFYRILLAGTAYCFLVSWVLHLAVEKPFLALKNHFRSS